MALKNKKSDRNKSNRTPRHGGEPHRLAIPGAHIDMSGASPVFVFNDKACVR